MNFQIKPTENKIIRGENKIYVYKEKYYERKAGKYALERKDKLWLQNGHYYDAGFRIAFGCGHRCVIFRHDALCK